MKHRVFFVLGCALLVALPMSVLLPGCGGGNSDVGSGSFSSTVTLSPSQVGTLSLTTGSTVANGFLRVAAPSLADTGDKTTRAFNFVVANGTYGFTGLFSSPNGFRVGGNFGNLPFIIVGQIPTNGGNGNYTITAGGQTVNGNF